MTVIGSLVASTLWHVVKIYPLTRECINSLQSEIWKFVLSKKPEWVRRETCMSDYLNGGLRIIILDIKSKALLIGRVFRFLEESEAPSKDFMRYYIGRALGINDNSRPNSDIPTPFYSHLLRVLREFAVDLGQPCTSKMYYLKRIEDCVTRYKQKASWLAIKDLVLV